jgi:hypothetical protein
MTKEKEMNKKGIFITRWSLQSTTAMSLLQLFVMNMAVTGFFFNQLRNVDLVEFSILYIVSQEIQHGFT